MQCRVPSRKYKFKDYTVLRAAGLTSVLAWFGQTLGDSTGSAASYELSKQVLSFDAFLSHNWAVGRLQKFLVLAVHFNTCKALGAGFAAMALAAGLTAAGLATRGYTLPVSVGVCLVVLLYGHWAAKLVKSEPMCFLDKLCINQDDDALRKKGTESLAAFMAHASTLVVCYSDIYLNRLWTSYEVVTYIALKGTYGMHIIPLATPVAVILGLCLPTIAACTFQAVAPNLGVARPFFEMVLVACSHTVANFWGRARALQRRRVQRHIPGFDVQALTCSDENDRILVERNIVDFMKAVAKAAPDATHEEALQAFNDYARRVLPVAFGECLGRGWPYKICLWLAFPLAAAFFEQWAAAVALGELSGWDAALGLVRACSASLLCFPVELAALACLWHRLLGLRTWCAEAAFVVLCSAVGVAFWEIMAGEWSIPTAVRRQLAETSAWLPALLGWYLLLLAAAVVAYRGPRDPAWSAGPGTGNWSTADELSAGSPHPSCKSTSSAAATSSGASPCIRQSTSATEVCCVAVEACRLGAPAAGERASPGQGLDAPEEEEDFFTV